MSTSKANNEVVENRRQNEQMLDEMSRLNNELVNLQRQLAIKNARLEQLNEQKNQLLGIATHELRNPIASIVSGCRLIERGQMSEDKLKSTIKEIYKVSDKMLHLVDNLLDVSKIETGQLSLEKTSTDITEILTHVVEFHRLFARRKDIELKLKFSGTIPKLDIDVSKIEQVLNNLISNAIKFSPKGTEVRVLAEPGKDEFVLKVEDQGPGIPEQEQGKLFKPFSRISNRPTEGESSSGLGLSIAKNIIEAHKGRIWVENMPETGSRFVLALPVK